MEEDVYDFVQTNCLLIASHLVLLYIQNALSSCKCHDNSLYMKYSRKLPKIRNLKICRKENASLTECMSCTPNIKKILKIIDCIYD